MSTATAVLFYLQMALKTVTPAAHPDSAECGFGDPGEKGQRWAFPLGLGTGHEMDWTSDRGATVMTFVMNCADIAA